MTPHDDSPGGSIQDSVAKLLDGELTEEEFAQLADRLREDPDAREDYFDCVSLETHLEHVYAPPLTRSGNRHAGQAALMRKQVKWALGIAAAAAVMVAAVMWVIQVRKPDPGAIAFQLCGNSRWAIEGSSDPRGTSLSPGATLRLEQGVAELNLPHSVRAVVEAPAVIALVDDRTLRLDRGRGFFEVDSMEGRGFTVTTRQQRIVDLGTAFGVDAGTGLAGVKLHVFEGRVRVDSSEGVKGEIIETNRSVLLDGIEVERDIERPSSGFLRQLPATVEVVFEDDFESGLAPERNYAVLIEPLAIRDLEGNRFPGIDDNSTWNFSTGLSHARTVSVKNPGFEEDGDEKARGGAVANWQTGGGARGWGVDRQSGNLVPTEGEFFGKLIRNAPFVQELDEVIAAGTTYELTVDVGLTKAGAVLGLFGSDRGADVVLAETKVSLAGQDWLRNQTVTYTATHADATGQTLGIVLKRLSGKLVAFDRVRLGASGLTPGDRLPEDFGSLAVESTDAADGSSYLRLLQIHPADNAKEATPGGKLTMAFDRPIKLGSGRIFLRNITDWSTAEIAVGGPRTVVDGRMLTIIPPTGLADGERAMGRVGGWDCDAWVGVFNPAAEGNDYRHEDLGADTDARGVLGSMSGPIMATFGENPAGASIRRGIGSIAPDSRYTVSVSIGVRDDGGEDLAQFDGYTIRLRSGDHVLAEISDDAPPGPPNSVSPVGFSWSSADLPDGVSPGDSIIMEIAPNQASGEKLGYLDFDKVRVTAVGE